MKHNFQPNDVVALFDEYSTTPRKKKVHRVTPSGIAVLVFSSYERKFNPDGYERGSSGWRKAYIVPWNMFHTKMVAEARETTLRVHVNKFLAEAKGFTLDEIKAAVDKEIEKRLDPKRLS